MPDIERVRAEHERLRGEPPEEDRADRRAEDELRAENERLRAILDGTDEEALGRAADVADELPAGASSTDKARSILAAARSVLDDVGGG
jgi:hypothetical protein